MLSLILFSCQKKKEAENIQIIDRNVLSGIPSASGIEIVDGNLFIISDNTPWLYELNNDFTVQDTLLIAPEVNLEGEVFDKDTKFDFEGMASFHQEGKWNLFIFGSGSKSHERNKLVWVEMGDSISSKVYDLGGFYQSIIRATNLGKKNMNLEGVSIVNGRLYLFNRGDNSVWEFSLQEFLSFLINGKKFFPELRRYNIDLPILRGVQAGFSGASELEEGSQIIFTASLEDTENWVDDGEVLGSYIGLIDLNHLKNGYKPFIFPLKENGKTLKLKVESVEVKKRNDKTYHLLLVTDSDGGASELLEAKMSIK